MKIAALGPAGTFSHEAALKRNPRAEILFKETVRDVFEAVDADEVGEALVPIENSVSGTIGMTLDALMEFDMHIVAELLLPIKHNLVGHDGLKRIRCLYVHPATYEQCEKFIRAHLPGVKIIHTSSNAASAESIIQKSDVVAIVPEEAALIYKLPVIKKNIQDTKFNITRFIVISKKEAARTKRDRTSIAIYPQFDKPGLLYSLLGQFAKNDVNLTKIESRPSKGKLGDYIFYIDLQGNSTDPNVSAAFKEIEKDFFLKILGSYPREY